MWVNRLSQVLSHASIVLASALAALFVIDFFKLGEMAFLANRLTKWMLFALCACVLINAPIQLLSLYRLRALRKYNDLRRR